MENPIIQYCSDLHLEFRGNSAFLQENPLEVKGDIFVLAGDIILLGKNSLENHPFFDWCSNNFKETYIVPGNHEYYKSVELSDSQYDFEYKIRYNVRYLNNKSIVIGNTELFFTTLWSIIAPQEIGSVQCSLSDCRLIKYNGSLLSSFDYQRLHLQSLFWLKNAVLKSKAEHKIVVTHHCPTFRFRDSRFIGSTINSAFCVNLDEYIESSDIDVWIFGHTHTNIINNNIIGCTTLLCNQMGYVAYNEHKLFKLNATINIQ